MAGTDTGIPSRLSREPEHVPSHGTWDIVLTLVRARTVGVFIDQAMSVFTTALGSSLVSFNRLDLANQTATVAFQPYRADLEQTVDGVRRLLAEHPLYQWFTSQPDWSPVRISDVAPWATFKDSRLLKEVLAPVGACHTIVIMLSPPAEGQWVYFAVNRADPDFTDDELALCARLQPVLVALYAHLTVPGQQPDRQDAAPVALTRRERAVLGYLADGLTAEAIAHRLSTRPTTVRKHLQNLYGKLGTSDRLGAVIRARDLGLLGAEDLSREITWNVRYEWGSGDQAGQP